jgi:D-psicose/D-tagatose/L-ribulose 3-epimerase
MKLGAHALIWAAPFTTESLPLIEKVRSLGGEVIDIPLGQDEPPFDTRETKKTLRSLGMEATVAANIVASRDLTSNDKAIREAGFRYLENCIRTCMEIEAKNLIGPLHAELRKSVILSTEEKKVVWDNCVESLRKAAKRAEQEGITICIEPLNRFESYFLNTVEDGLKLVNDIGSINVKLLLDTFHMNIEEKDISSAIRAAGDKIGHFHACENDRGIPGSGHIDWEGVASALSEIGYDGYVTIESYNPDIPQLAQRTGIFRRFAPDQDTLVKEGLSFLRNLFKL